MTTMGKSEREAAGNGLLDKPAKNGYDFSCQTSEAADASATDFRSPKEPCECNGLQVEEVSSNHYI